MDKKFSSGQLKRYPVYHPIETRFQSEQSEKLLFETYSQSNSKKLLASEGNIKANTDMQSSNFLGQDHDFVSNQGTSKSEKIFASVLKPSRQHPTTLKDALKNEKDFLDYVMSLPSRESLYSQDDFVNVQMQNLSINDTLKASNKLGFEHLDNLCKLMQHLGELREANIKLQRKVQYLEEVKPISKSSSFTKSNNQIYTSSDFGLDNKTNLYLTMAQVPQNLELTEEFNGDQMVNTMAPKASRFLKNRRSNVFKSKSQSMLDKSPWMARERSKSVGYEESLGSEKRTERAENFQLQSETSNKASRKFPNWSKFKEVLGFEKHQLSGLKFSQTNSISKEKENKNELKTFAKTILKNQIEPTYRVEIKPNQMNYQIQKSKSFSCAVNSCLNEEQASFVNDDCSEYEVDSDLDYESKKNNKGATQKSWKKVKSIIHPSKEIKSIKESKNFKVKGSYKFNQNNYKQQSSIKAYESLSTNDSSEVNNCNINYRPLRSLPQFINFKNISKSNHLTRTDLLHDQKFLDNYEPVNLNDASSSQISPGFSSELSKSNQQYDSMIYQVSAKSPPIQQRTKWIKMKKMLANAEEGAQSVNIKSGFSNSLSIPASSPSNSDASAGDEDAIIEIKNDKFKNFSNECEFNQIQSLIPSQSNEQIADKIQKIQRNLSVDFSKKIMEWEKLRSNSTGVGVGIENENETYNKEERKSSLPKLVKKRKSQRSVDKISRIKVKDINWLEKELSKIVKESQRLSKERDKYEERAKSLIKLKEAITNLENSNPKKEVLVRTSAGEFRFEGISDDFTRKLYEWELKKGVCPKSSTIALLNSSRRFSNLIRFEVIESKLGYKNGSNLVFRNVSKSESNILQLLESHVITSERTFSSLPNLKQNQLINQKLINNTATLDLSKDISHKNFFKEGNGCDNVNDKSNIKVSLNSTARLVDNQKISEKNDQDNILIMNDRDDNYCHLLEQNVLLLKNLENKKELCKKLECELRSLEDKMEKMSAKHQKEIEHYRDKLWELHAVGFKSINLDTSTKVIKELKERIEQLQIYSEKLNSDKEALEESFRYHSEKQTKLSLELIEKTKQFQQKSFLSQNNFDKQKGKFESKPTIKYNYESVNMMHELSTRLLQQAWEMENALIERNKVICKIQWELLNRDLLIIKLQAQLEGYKWQQGCRPLAKEATKRRHCYSQKRSESEKLHSKTGLKINANESDDNLVAILPMTKSKDWLKFNYNEKDFSKTIYELKTELLKLCSYNNKIDESNEKSDENFLIKSNVKNLQTSPKKSAASKYCDYFEDQNITKNKISKCENLRYLSNLNSNFESDLNLNYNEGDKLSYRVRKPKTRCRQYRDKSSSSESSLIEKKSFTSLQWSDNYSNSKFDLSKNNSNHSQLNDIVSHCENDFYKNKRNQSFLDSNSDVIIRRTFGSCSKFNDNNSCLNQSPETSSSILNEKLEECSLTSEHQFTFFETSGSVKNNSHFCFPLDQEKNAGIPMIDEETSEVIIDKEQRFSDSESRLKYASRTNKGFLNHVNTFDDALEQENSPSPVEFRFKLPQNYELLSKKGERNQKPELSFEKLKSKTELTNLRAQSIAGNQKSRKKTDSFLKSNFEPAASVMIDLAANETSAKKLNKSSSLSSKVSSFISLRRKSKTNIEETSAVQELCKQSLNLNLDSQIKSASTDIK